MTFPSIYPKSPFDPNNCFMFLVHDRRLSPLNFCSLESIVKVIEPEDMEDRSQWVNARMCLVGISRIRFLGIVVNNKAS